MAHTYAQNFLSFRGFRSERNPGFFHSENLLISFFFHSFFVSAVLSKILSTSTAKIRIEAEYDKEEEKSMKNCDKQNLIISIESSIDFIESHLDSADKTIAFVFKKHSVRNLEKSSIHTLQNLFSELYAIEADLR